MLSDDFKATASAYKYHALAGIYVLATGFFFFRVHRQPYPQSMKFEQYESIFKATTLSSVLVGVGMGSGFHRYRAADKQDDRGRHSS